MSEREFSELIERAKRVHMTPDEQEQQRRSFAYGNANIENAAVTRSVIDRAAKELSSDSKSGSNKCD